MRALVVLSASVAVASVAASILAAANDWRDLSWYAALLVALVCGGHAWAVSRQPLLATDTWGTAAGMCARAMIWPFAILFAWGGGVFALGYGLTDLHWQHWWQYALVFALLLVIVSISAVLLSREARLQSAPEPSLLVKALVAMTGLQGVAAIVGLVFLVASGKLEADKPDWLANQVFLIGGVAVALMSVAALNGQLRAAKLKY